MKFETAVATALATTLGVSSTMSYVRAKEERGRRGGLKGTSVLLDPEGRAIEYRYQSTPAVQEKPVLLLENGLGAPLECWDWIEYLLRHDFRILSYHRGGYARSRSRRRPAELVEILLRHCAPSGPVIVCGHSIGALVAANTLAGSEYVRSRASALFIIDGTDAHLLEEDRRSSRRSGMFRQDSIRRALGTLTGMNRWVTSPVARDIEYRPDIQEAYLTTEASLRSVLSSWREFTTEPTFGQHHLAKDDIPRYVISSEKNTEQETELARRLSADMIVVEASGHRSVIGRLACAQQVAEYIREKG